MKEDDDIPRQQNEKNDDQVSQEKIRNQWEFKDGDVEDDPADIFNWLITYKDGKEETFRGFVDEAFEYALTKSKMFAIEKVEE